MPAGKIPFHHHHRHHHHRHHCHLRHHRLLCHVRHYPHHRHRHPELIDWVVGWRGWPLRGGLRDPMWRLQGGARLVLVLCCYTGGLLVLCCYNGGLLRYFAGGVLVLHCFAGATLVLALVLYCFVGWLLHTSIVLWVPSVHYTKGVHYRGALTLPHNTIIPEFSAEGFLFPTQTWVLQLHYIAWGHNWSTEHKWHAFTVCLRVKYSSQ